jgi:CheY-like chemotaxis protein
MGYSKSLLLVEDDKDLQVNLEYFLNKIGYRLFVASTGEEEWRLAEGTAAGGSPGHQPSRNERLQGLRIDQAGWIEQRDGGCVSQR